MAKVSLFIQNFKSVVNTPLSRGEGLGGRSTETNENHEKVIPQICYSNFAFSLSSHGEGQPRALAWQGEARSCQLPAS